MTTFGVATAAGCDLIVGALTTGVACIGITGWLGDVPAPVVTVVGTDFLPASGSISTSRGRFEPMFTVANWSPDTGVVVGVGVVEAAAEVAAAGVPTGASGFRLIVLVCRSRSGAGGIARLTA